METYVTPVYVVYDGEEDEGLLENVILRAGEFIGVLMKVLISPTLVFSRIPTVKPFFATMMFFLMFGGVLAVPLTINVLPVVGLSFDAISVFFVAVFIGWLFCMIASALTYGVVRALGGMGSFAHTMSVYALSLTPVLIGSLILIYLDYATSVFALGGNVTAENALGVLLFIAIAVGCLAWNIVLQSIGLSVMHRVNRKTAAIAVILVDAASAIVLSALVFIVGIVFAYWNLNILEPGSI
jgi:hypothetical protein